MITQEWRDWAEQQHNTVPLSSKGKSPVIAFGGDVCYKVEEDGKLPVDPKRNVGTTEKGKSSKFRIFFDHVWNDIVASWWKCASYIIAMCCIVFAVASHHGTRPIDLNKLPRSTTSSSLFSENLRYMAHSSIPWTLRSWRAELTRFARRYMADPKKRKNK